MKFTIEQLEKIILEAPEGAEYYTPGYDVKYRKITGQNTYYGFVDTEWMKVVDKLISIERINKGFNLVKLAEQLQEMKMKEEVKLTVKQARELGVVFVEGDELGGSATKDDRIASITLYSGAEAINDGDTYHDNNAVNSFVYRDNKGKLPCDGDLMVEVEYYNNHKDFGVKAISANSIDWSMQSINKSWKPHLPSLIKIANKMKEVKKVEIDLNYLDEISINGYSNEKWVYGCPCPDSELSVVFRKETASHMTIPTVRCVKITAEQKQAQIDEKNAIKLHDLANANYPAYAPNDWDSATVEIKEMWIAVAKKVTFKDEIDS